MKDQVTKLSGYLTMLFSSVADDLAHDTQFVKRERGYSGSKFVRTLVFGWIPNAMATIDDFAEDLGVTAGWLGSVCRELRRGGWGQFVASCAASRKGSIDKLPPAMCAPAHLGAGCRCGRFWIPCHLRQPDPRHGPNTRSSEYRWIKFLGSFIIRGGLFQIAKVFVAFVASKVTPCPTRRIRLGIHAI